MEGGAWWATVHGLTESDTTENTFTVNNQKFDFSNQQSIHKHTHIYLNIKAIIKVICNFVLQILCSEIKIVTLPVILNNYNDIIIIHHTVT